MTDERKRPWPPSIVDSLGRGWSYEKLDRLLADPDVTAVVEEMDRAARGTGRVFQAARARDWAEIEGRSEAAFALLLVLRWRRFSQKSERST